MGDDAGKILMHDDQGGVLARKINLHIIYLCYNNVAASHRCSLNGNAASIRRSKGDQGCVWMGIFNGTGTD